jgi:N-acyl-D-amino-acid deacylase
MLDILIKDATVIDRSGKPRYLADIEIEGNRIKAVENLSQAEVVEVLSGRGLVATPGSIDMRSHADFTLPFSHTADGKVHQRVTFELVGNCGSSPAPIDDRSRLVAMVNTILGGPGLDWEWDTFESYLKRLHKSGTAVNVGTLVGYGAICQRKHTLARPCCVFGCH